MNFSPENGMEFCLLLLGAAVGVCYAFDGWTGSAKEVELQRTARLKNLKYAATGFFVALIADVKAVGIVSDKARLLQCYVEGFFVTAIVVIGLISLALLRKYTRVSKTSLAEFLPADFSPVMDYLFYGFNFYRSNSSQIVTKAKAEQVQHRTQFITAFVPAYVLQTSAAIAAVSNYVSQPSPQIRAMVSRQILECIRAVVIEYYVNPQDFKVDANYMLAYEKSSPPPKLKERLQFADKAADDYEIFLALEGFSKDDDKEDFILPVGNKRIDGWDKTLLPGAPEAFLRETTVVIDDTAKMSFPSGLSEKTISAIEAYFRKKSSFKSFASLGIIYAGRWIGIVNVEANMTSIFGKTDQKKDEVASLLKPFCLLLGFVLANPPEPRLATLQQSDRVKGG